MKRILAALRAARKSAPTIVPVTATSLTYAQFKEEILNTIARTLGIPKSILDGPPSKLTAAKGGLRFNGTVKLRARVSLSKKTRAFEGVAYTGGIMYPTLILEGEEVNGPVVVDLNGLVIPSQVRPVLDDHDDSTDGVIGQTSLLARRGQTLIARGVVYTRKERAQKILEANDGGHTWQLSVGTDVLRVQKLAAGMSAVVNGQKFTGPLTIVRQSYLNDLSFVAEGADDKTHASIAAGKAAVTSAKGIAMDPEFQKWLDENFSIDGTTLTAPQLAKFQAMYQADQTDDSTVDAGAAGATTATTTATSQAAAARNATSTLNAGAAAVGTDGASTGNTLAAAQAQLIQTMRVETARQQQISRLCAARGDNPAIQEIYDRAINSDMTTSDTHLAVLLAARPRVSEASSSEGDDQVPLILEASLLASSGMPENRLKAHFSEKTLNEALSKRWRGATLQQIADRAILRAGLSWNGMRGEKSHMEAAKLSNSKLMASNFTSFAVQNILENVGHKLLLDAYAAVKTKWQTFCAIQSNQDFKVHSRYALDFTNTFRKVGPQGDLSQLKFTDRKYTSQLDTFGARFSIDRQTWKNDDLGAIKDRLAGVGAQGAKTIDQVVHSTMLGGIGSFFAAGNSNYLKGAGAAFGIAGLTAAEALIENQVGADNQPLGVEFETLLVGTLLKTLAGQVYTSTKLSEVFDSTNTSRKGPVGQDNPFANKYQPVTDAYLSNTLIKDQDGNAIPNQDNALWFMFGQQSNNAAINVAFLNGAQSPTVDTITMDSEILGFQIVAYIDFGVGFGDPRLALCCNPADVS